MLHLSGSQWIIYGALSVVWALLGYRLSENDRKVLGRTPWGLPVGAVGLLLVPLAPLGSGPLPHRPLHRGAPGPAEPSHPGLSDGRTPPIDEGEVAGVPLVASDLFPAYPRPANSQPAERDPIRIQTEEPSDRQELPGPTGDDQPAIPTSWPHSPPAWHPDPSGRFHYRWWDGNEWTSQVSTDGHHLIDTNPDQRIGPY